MPKELLAALERAAVSAEKSLNFSYNRLTDAGAVALAQSPYMAGLQRLDLDGNKITDAGAIALAQSPYMAGLQHLDLDSNDITDAGRAVLDRRAALLSLQGPDLAAAAAAEPADLFLLARLFLEQGRVGEGLLFAAIVATPQNSLFWGWLEAKAEQVEDCAVPQALTFFPTNARLQQRASFCRRRDVALEAALF